MKEYLSRCSAPPMSGKGYGLRVGDRLLVIEKHLEFCDGAVPTDGVTGNRVGEGEGLLRQVEQRSTFYFGEPDGGFFAKFPVSAPGKRDEGVRDDLLVGALAWTVTVSVLCREGGTPCMVTL